MSTSATRVLHSRARVLKAATALFAAKGFHETSTREVARKARVNEITIFRHFKNKQELYLQVLNSKLGVMVPESLLPLLQSSGNSEEVFLSLAEHLQQLLDPVFLRLVFYAALEKPELLKKCYSPRLTSFHEILGEHMRERIDGGVLRNVDPMLMGRALVGIIAYQQILSQLLGGGDSPGTSPPNPARTYMDIWLRGALKPDSPPRRHSPDESSTQVPEADAWPARL
jgi:AcrR family transcriptional regulator